MATCTVGEMRVLLDSIANVVPYVNFILKDGLASFSAFDTHLTVLCTAALPVAYEASGCAYMHVPSCRAALRSISMNTPLTITIDDDNFTFKWASQTHTFTHIRLRPSPPLASLFPAGCFSMPSCDLLKFVRDTNAATIDFKCADNYLHIVATTDACKSQYFASPANDHFGSPITERNTSITCTTRNVVSIAKASLFSKSVFISVCLNEVLFVYRSGAVAHASFVLARAL